MGGVNYTKEYKEKKQCTERRATRTHARRHNCLHNTEKYCVKVEPMLYYARLLRGDGRGQPEAEVVRVRHNHRTDQTRGHSPRCSPYQLSLCTTSPRPHPQPAPNTPREGFVHPQSRRAGRSPPITVPADEFQATRTHGRAHTEQRIHEAAQLMNQPSNQSINQSEARLSRPH